MSASTGYPVFALTIRYLGSLSPASAKSLIKLHQALVLVAWVLVASGLRESKLGAEQRSLPIENLEVCGDTSHSSVPYARMDPLGSVQPSAQLDFTENRASKKRLERQNLRRSQNSAS